MSEPEHHPHAPHHEQGEPHQHQHHHPNRRRWTRSHTAMVVLTVIAILAMGSFIVLLGGGDWFTSLGNQPVR